MTQSQNSNVDGNGQGQIDFTMINPGLRKAVIVLPVAWTGAWLTYYGMWSRLGRYTDV
jgi:hypothetical protein